MMEKFNFDSKTRISIDNEEGENGSLLELVGRREKPRDCKTHKGITENVECMDELDDSLYTNSNKNDCHTYATRVFYDSLTIWADFHHMLYA